MHASIAPYDKIRESYTIDFILRACMTNKIAEGALILAWSVLAIYSTEMKKPTPCQWSAANRQIRATMK